MSDNSNLLEPIQPANARVSSTFLNRLARGPWRTVAALGKALFHHTLAEALPSQTFIGEAFRVSADGGTAVTLKRGLALFRDTSWGDEWYGDLRPVYADGETIVSIATNSDGSGDDRIDSLFVRPVPVEQDPITFTLKDSEDGPTYELSLNSARYLEWEYLLVEGTAGAVPAAPDPPAPSIGQHTWIRIADIERPNTQAAVNQSEVTDQRTQEVSRFGWVQAYAGLVVGALNEAHARLAYNETTDRLDVLDQADAAGDLYARNITQKNEVAGTFIVNASIEVTPYANAVGFTATDNAKTGTGTWDIAVEAGTIGSGVYGYCVVSPGFIPNGYTLQAYINSATSIIVKCFDASGTAADLSDGNYFHILAKSLPY